MNTRESFSSSRNVRLARLQPFQELLWLLEIVVDVGDREREETSEEIAGPFDRVFDLVWEILQRAHWNRSLGWVSR